jgi:hypothetical protein
MAEELTTTELARLLGVRACSLSRWAQAHGPGSVRAGWRVAGRRGGGPQAPYRWRRVDGQKSPGTLRPFVLLTPPMPAKLPDGIARTLTTTIRLSQAERDRLAKVAAKRGTTISDLLREGLFAIGALEVQAS